MKKKLPKLKSDKEAEDFVATADLTDYDLSGMKRMRFAFATKDRASLPPCPHQTTAQSGSRPSRS